MIRRSLRIAVFAIVLVTLAGVPPVGSQQLGTIDFPTSGNADAQKHFVTGVLFLHSFEYGDAAQAFREAPRDGGPGLHGSSGNLASSGFQSA